MSSNVTPDDRRYWADVFGLNEQYLYQCLSGLRNMDPTRALSIETESKGALTRRMLCQDTWAGIWPELADSK